MQGSSRFVLVAALVVFAGLSALLFTQYHQATTTLASVRSAQQETSDRYSEAIGSIASIQDSLNTIVLGDDAMRLTNSSWAAEHGLNRSETDQVLDRLGQLRAGVERSKERIAQLDEHLRRSGVRIAGLERMIAMLKHSVVAKEEMIASLSSRVDSLSSQVVEKDATIDARNHELGTVFCIMGNKHDLTKSGVVVASGGVLGLGKTLKASGSMDESLCTTIDTDTEATLDIPARKALVLTAQPLTSYALETNGDHTTLRILDPKEFRKVRHLVIVETA